MYHDKTKTPINLMQTEIAFDECNHYFLESLLNVFNIIKSIQMTYYIVVKDY